MLDDETDEDGIDINEIKIGNNINEIEIFCYGILRQDKNLVADYYLKVKRCNNIANFSEKRLKNKFIDRLTLEN
ncbi:6694_t:CDS:2 [Funneliformis mosseae]|uniref:6694_t:CDS:1 n=1 Tax=Funneliformis mosseae TaxID=27381 RepID=A0A9N9DGQ1_FUNMO|nr:6694_t:CDS:2 [Funneliformis mosseae]